MSCSKEESKLTASPETITLYSKGTTQITTNADDAIFKSSDEFYAEVDATGMVTANKVGNTEIIVTGKGSSIKVPVTIMPKYKLFPDLDEYIGKSSSYVTSTFGSNYTAGTTSKGYITYTYTDYNIYATIISFTFENDVVSSIGVAVPTTYTSQLTSSLIERYTVTGTLNDVYYFLNHDENVLLGMQVYTASYLMVIYMSYSSSKASDNSEINLVDYFGEIQNL